MVILRLRRPKRGEPDVLPPAVEPHDPLLDLLNRDQRTTLTIDRKSRRDVGYVDLDFRLEGNRSNAPCRPSDASSCGCSDRAKSRGRGSRKRLARLTRLACGLGEVFIVGVCLLTVVRVPVVMSAPSTRHAKPTEQMHSHKPTEDSLSYSNPCGTRLEEKINKTYLEMTSRESDPAILRRIILQTKNALDFAEGFRERYVERTFHSPFENHHAQWASQKYDWLPNEGNVIPKRLGTFVDQIHLKSKTFDEFLVNIYEYLQKFAVALEQVVADQRKTHGEFRENFKLMENQLRGVLCEIRVAMIERNVSPRGHVPRTIMKDDIRKLNQPSFRNMRDWFIFRDLMNCLEYVIQVFNFIELNLPESTAADESS